MMVSIIIPTLNASKVLPNLLSILNHQTIKRKELIIIDSSSTDDTIDIANSFGAKIITIRREEFDHGKTRNLGAVKARGDIIIYLTQDAIPVDRHYIENLIKPLKSPEIAASYGRQIPRADATPPEQFARIFNYPDNPIVKTKEDIPRLGIKTFFFTNACSAIRKKEFEEAGRFPEDVIMDEDIIFAAKLILKGYKIAYVPDAKVIHSHSYSLIQQFKRYFDIGVAFNHQQWFLKLASAEKEGLKYLIHEIKFLREKDKWFWIPYALIAAGIKYIGYNLGLIEDKLPENFKKCISMHTYFWKTRRSA